MKKKISDYYIKLLEEEHQKVSVTYLCQCLDISRKTFYYYFRDIEDLIEFIIYENNIKPLIMVLDLNIDMKECITSFYQGFFKHKIFYTRIMQEHHDTFNQCLLKYLPRVGDYHYRKYLSDDKEIEWISYKFAMMQCSLMNKWINEGMVESAEFMARVYMFSG